MLRLALCLIALCGPALAQPLALPQSAIETFRTVQDPGAYALPSGVWQDGTLPSRRVEGRIDVTAWRLPQSDLSSFQLVQPLRDALSAQGYEVLLDCAARRCGGFDFRFATLVLPAPQMFVSLDDYHFVSALHPDGSAVSVLASKGPRDGYVQIIRAGAGPAPEVNTTAPTPLPAKAAGLAETLDLQGHVVLSDMVFAPGSSSLTEGRIASLDALAAYLRAHPERRIVFVGHTDATGSLDANKSVSLRRAETAVRYLRDQHDTPNAQISAEGAGYLAPVASNLTDTGREANRRVEAVLIATE